MKKLECLAALKKEWKDAVIRAQMASPGSGEGMYWRGRAVALCYAVMMVQVIYSLEVPESIDPVLITPEVSESESEAFDINTYD